MDERRRTNGPAAVLGLLAGGIAASVGGSASAQETSGYLCSDWSEAVAVDWRARTLVAGTAADNRVIEWDGGHAHFGDFGLARLLPDGSVDRSFGVEGSLIVDAGDFDSLSAVAPAFGGLLVAGTTSQHVGDRTGPKDLVVLRVTEAGALATEFGSAGLARFNLGGSVTVASIAPSWSGKTYVAGTLGHEDALSEGFVLRLDARGGLDATFGEGGVVRLGAEGEDVRFHGVGPLWDGVIIGGHASREGQVGAIAVRLDQQGQQVVEYGQSGIARYDLAGEVANDGAAVASKLGAALIALSITGESGEAQVTSVRFDRDGRLVPAASGDVSVLDVPGGTQDSVYAAALRGRSVYLAGGTSPDDWATGDAFVASLAGGREIEPAFGGGIETLHLDLEYTSFLGAVAHRGGITVAGYDFGEMPDTLPPSDALVVRYLPDGSMDERFGEAGVVLLDYRGGATVCGPRIDVNGGEGGHDHSGGDDHDHEGEDGGAAADETTQDHEGGAACSGHGHLDGATCHCDAGYVTDPSDSSQCIAK